MTVTSPELLMMQRFSCASMMSSVVMSDFQVEPHSRHEAVVGVQGLHHLLSLRADGGAGNPSQQTANNDQIDALKIAEDSGDVQCISDDLEARKGTAANRAGQFDGGRPGTENNRLIRLDQVGGGLGDSDFLLAVDALPNTERMLRNSSERTNAAPVGAHEEPTLGKHIQIVSRRNSGHSKPANYLIDGDAAALIENLHDLTPPFFSKKPGRFALGHTSDCVDEFQLRRMQRKAP